MLHGIEDRRHRLRLIHKYELTLSIRRHLTAQLEKQARIGQVPRPLRWVCEIYPHRFGREHGVQQRRLARLACAENQMHKRSLQTRFQLCRIPSVIHALQSANLRRKCTLFL